jgi:hypothetical protein
LEGAFNKIITAEYCSNKMAEKIRDLKDAMYWPKRPEYSEGEVANHLPTQILILDRLIAEYERDIAKEEKEKQKAENQNKQHANS